MLWGIQISYGFFLRGHLGQLVPQHDVFPEYKWTLMKEMSSFFGRLKLLLLAVLWLEILHSTEML
jgi:hypothetical protein